MCWWTITLLWISRTAEIVLEHSICSIKLKYGNFNRYETGVVAFVWNRLCRTNKCHAAGLLITGPVMSPLVCRTFSFSPYKSHQPTESCKIETDGQIFRHQSSQSSSFSIGKIGNEFQIFVQNVSFFIWLIWYKSYLMNNLLYAS